jgi:hypothetical protein
VDWAGNWGAMQFNVLKCFEIFGSTCLEVRIRNEMISAVQCVFRPELFVIKWNYIISLVLTIYTTTRMKFHFILIKAVQKHETTAPSRGAAIMKCMLTQKSHYWHFKTAANQTAPSHEECTVQYCTSWALVNRLVFPNRCGFYRVFRDTQKENLI